MTALAIAWLLLPFLAAFSVAILPRVGLAAAAITVACSLVIGALGAISPEPMSLQLMGPHGVALGLDALAAPFVVLNALVTAAVLLDRTDREGDQHFLVVVLVLHGGINSALVCQDLISLYVALEVVGIAAFLLIAQPRTVKSLWISLRYLIVGNVSLLLYLIGTAEVYRSHGTFLLADLAGASAGPMALVLVGLLTKSGVFLSGLWLPRTHAESPSDVSAMLSGTVVAAGACPLIRLTEAAEPLGPLVLWIGLASAGLGLVFALLESDVKRLLAWSTVSQMGLVVLVPSVAGIYALSHGLAKASLFLVSRQFPSRRLENWTQAPLPLPVWLPLQAASLSIAGCPLLIGFLAKESLLQELSGPPMVLATLASVGTAAVFSRLWCVRLAAGTPARWSAGVVLLSSTLLIAQGLALFAGTWERGQLVFWASSVVKALGILLAGWLVHRLIGAVRERIQLPDLERLDDLLGGLGVVGAGILLLLVR